MNRQQLVDAVGERLGDRRAAAVAVEAVLDTVTAALAEGERVAIFGFGVFEKVDRAARTARNPSTGGTVDVPATAVPRFRPGQALKDAVNGRSSGTGRSAPARARAVPASDPDAEPSTSATTGRAAEPGRSSKGAKPDKAGKPGKTGKPGKAGKTSKSGSGKSGKGASDGGAKGKKTKK